MAIDLHTDEMRAPDGLRAKWQAFRTENPKSRIRDAANALKVSEAELVATGVGETAVRLEPAWKDIMAELPKLGRVMALTRNEACVHERKGRYEDVQVGGKMGIVLGPDIDLRLFLSRWNFAFAVSETSNAVARRSLQIFDDSGQAVHKIYAIDDTDVAALDALIARFRAGDQSRSIRVKPAPLSVVPKPDSEIDAEGLADTWRALQDTHDFFPMLRKYEVARLQAFRLVGKEFAQPVARLSGRTVMEAASMSSLEIMIFVGNANCIQIHTGPVKRLVTTGPWFNVLDPDFNLHLREDLIHEAWLIRKPTRDGDVTSVELYDAKGETIAMLFGKRKPGLPEDKTWRALANSMAGSA
jgi:putative hemin transport protein